LSIFKFDDDWSCFYPVVAHHARVVMFQVVTVAQIKTSMVLKLEKELDPLTGHDQNCILPSLVYITSTQGLTGITVSGLNLPLNDLKLQVVDVHGVR